MTIRYDRTGYPTVTLNGKRLPPLEEAKKDYEEAVDDLKDEYAPYCNDGMHYLSEPVAQPDDDEGHDEFEDRVGPEGTKPRSDIWWEYDRRGITIGLVCKQCVRKKKSKYR
jgi:hypothetical protein